MTPPFIRYKKHMVLSKFQVETEIIEEAEDLLELCLEIFEVSGQHITRLMFLNFTVNIDDIPANFSIKEEERMGIYHCVIDVSKLTSGQHRLSIEIRDNLGITSDPIQLEISKNVG